jgi:hypothetical protein
MADPTRTANGNGDGDTASAMEKILDFVWASPTCLSLVQAGS